LSLGVAAASLFILLAGGDSMVPLDEQILAAQNRDVARWVLPADSESAGAPNLLPMGADSK
jgi:hypothetical protein